MPENKTSGRPPKRSAASSRARRLERGTVLVLAQDARASDALRGLFTAEGAEVRTTAGAADALAIMRDWGPDVLVVELSFPVVEGLDFIRAVRRDPALQRTPAIALARDARFAPRAAEDAGVDRLFVSPVEDERLLSEVARMLDVRRRAAGS